MINKLLVFDLKGKLACWKKFYSNSSSFTYEIPTRTNLIGLIASILELNRDSYYELFSSGNCKLSLQVKSRMKKQFHCMNYFKQPNKRNYTQVRLEILQPTNIQNDFLTYRVFVWIKDIKAFSELIKKVKTHNSGFGIYLGQRQFRGDIDFVGIVTDIHQEKNNSTEVESILNLKNLKNKEDLILDKSSICIERMPIDFEFAEKDKDGTVDKEKLNSNYLNRELLKIGQIAYSKDPDGKLYSKTQIYNTCQINLQGKTQTISFYEAD